MTSTSNTDHVQSLVSVSPFATVSQDAYDYINSSPYTLDRVESLESTIDNWELLEDQLEYISTMSNWHRDEEDKIRAKQRRYSEKKWGTPEYGALVHSARHHVLEYTSLSADYRRFSAKRAEIEKVLEEQGLIGDVIIN
jgi:hypothetical protein